jgi:hypothetical protein
MKITKNEFLSILKNKRACPEAIKWVKESKTETFIELWNECDRADWMLWLLATMIKEKEWPSRKTVVLCACDCAETSLQFIPENENRPKIAIQTAREWTEGKTTKIECVKAAADTYDSYVASASSASSAASAALAYASNAYDASNAYAAYDASVSASYAAYAASYAVSYADSYAAEKEALKNMADIVRKRVI